MKHAWQMERELRDAAIPVDRRIHDSQWYQSDTAFPQGDDLMRMFWEAKVPGSGAPEIPYLEMVQAQGNRGYDVSAAERLIPDGIRLYQEKSWDALRALTAQLLDAVNSAPVDKDHPIHRFLHPASWADVRAAMGTVRTGPLLGDSSQLERRIYQAWLGQLAGGSFGTAIEGYTGNQIRKVYGEIRSYITQPETTNDDVVYELVFLDMFERMGQSITSREIGLEWVRQIPFGWSAEWVALRNLNMGIFPPQSGSFQNPYSHWIGAQMRGMVCGMLAPGWPLEAARLAHLDGVVSHDSNGVYGEMYAAVLTSLAFIRADVRTILREAAEYIPQQSQYAAVVRECLHTAAAEQNAQTAWDKLEKRYEQYNWIDAHPNIAAVIYALWYSQGDMTECFALLANAGLDVDCNAGLAGSVLGAVQDVPQAWAAPLGDLLETYIRGKEKLSIRALSQRTARLALRSQ